MAENSADIKFTADASSAINSLNQLQGMAKDFGSGFAQGMNPAVTALKLGTMFAGKLKDAFGELMKDSKKLVNESMKFNMPIAELQKMKAVADEVGVAAGSIVRAMKGLTKVLISDKTDAKYRMLSQMGLSDEDMNKMESNKAYAIEKIKEIYQTLSDVDKEKFGLAMFGGGFNQIKAMLDQSAEAAKDASARIYEANDSTIISFKALGNSLDDMGEVFKELVGWLAPWLGVIIEILQMILVPLLLVLKVAFQAVGLVINYVIDAVMVLVGAVVKAVGALGNFLTVIGLFPDKAKKTFDAIEKGGQKLADKGIQNAVDASVEFGGKVKEDADKAGKGLKKSAHNMNKYGNAIAEQLDYREVGGLAKEQNEEYQKQIGLYEKYKKQQEALDKKYSDIEKNENRKLTSEEQQERYESKAKLNELMAVAEGKALAAKAKLQAVTEKNVENEHSLTKLVDPKKDDKEFKEKFKAQMESRDAEEEELKTKQKLLAVEKDLKDLNEMKTALSVDENNNAKKLHEVKDEILKKEKEYAKLKKKAKDEDDAEVKRQAKEKDKLDRIQEKNKEKFQEMLEKDEIESMKKLGYGQQEIDKKLLEQKMGKIAREQKELERLQGEAQKEGTEQNIEAVEHQKANLISAYSEANSAMRNLMYSGGGSTVSNAAKKGMGGGISTSPIEKLSDVNNKQLEELKAIKAAIEKQLNTAPLPLAPK